MPPELETAGNARPIDDSFASQNIYDNLFLKALCQVLREQRESLGMSQEELAAKSQLHRTYISDIERGIRNFSIKTLSRVAFSFGITPSKLISLAEQRALELGQERQD